MMELTIHGRGGRGGVTLAKLIAATYFLRGEEVQAFGVYGAERSGAPVQAFVRVSNTEISCHNQIREPDHVLVIDPALIDRGVAAGMKPDGWLILNTVEHPRIFGDMFPGRKVATVDANGIAVANGLGTTTVPIVNTTLLGAVAKVLALDLSVAEAALAEAAFGGANVDAARAAFARVRSTKLPGRSVTIARPARAQAVSILDERVGGSPDHAHRLLGIAPPA